jgi:hypothetical protein
MKTACQGSNRAAYAIFGCGGVDDARQRVDPIVGHALAQQRCRDPDGGDQRQCRQPHQDCELGAEAEVAENMHDGPGEGCSPAILATPD